MMFFVTLTMREVICFGFKRKLHNTKLHCII